MPNPFIGEIRIFAGNFAPTGWMFCQGQILPISENETLFQLIGTTYGGDGESTFALPDLRGRLPLHQGPAHQMPDAGGAEDVTLTTQQMPVHGHPMQAVAGGVQGHSVTPGGMLPAESYNVVPYVNEQPVAGFNVGAIAGAGGSQPHTNLMPYLVVNFIISLYGVFPSPP